MDRRGLAENWLVRTGYSPRTIKMVTERFHLQTHGGLYEERQSPRLSFLTAFLRGDNCRGNSEMAKTCCGPAEIPSQYPLSWGLSGSV